MIARTDCKLWIMSASVFMQTLGAFVERELPLTEEFLRTVPQQLAAGPYASADDHKMASLARTYFSSSNNDGQEQGSRTRSRSRSWGWGPS